MNKDFKGYMSEEERNLRLLLEEVGHTALYADVSIPAWMYSKNETAYAMTKLSFIRGKIGKLERSANSWKSASIALGIVCLILLFWR